MLRRRCAAQQVRVPRPVRVARVVHLAHQLRQKQVRLGGLPPPPPAARRAGDAQHPSRAPPPARAGRRGYVAFHSPSDAWKASSSAAWRAPSPRARRRRRRRQPRVVLKESLGGPCRPQPGRRPRRVLGRARRAARSLLRKSASLAARPAPRVPRYQAVGARASTLSARCRKEHQVLHGRRLRAATLVAAVAHSSALPRQAQHASGPAELPAAERFRRRPARHQHGQCMWRTTCRARCPARDATTVPALLDRAQTIMLLRPESVLHLASAGGPAASAARPPGG